MKNNEKINENMEGLTESCIDVTPIIMFMDGLKEEDIKMVVGKLSIFSLNLIDTACKGRENLDDELGEMIQSGEDASLENLDLLVSELEILNPGDELNALINGVSNRTFECLDGAVSERVASELEMSDGIINRTLQYRHSLYN